MIGDYADRPVSVLEHRESDRPKARVRAGETATTPAEHQEIG